MPSRFAIAVDRLYRWRWRWQSAALVVAVWLVLALAGVHGWIDGLLATVMATVFWIPVLLRWGMAIPEAGAAFREGLRGE